MDERIERPLVLFNALQGLLFYMRNYGSGLDADQRNDIFDGAMILNQELMACFHMPLNDEMDDPPKVELGGDTRILNRDVVIPAGTIFTGAPQKTKRFGQHWMADIGLGQNSVLEVSVSDEEANEEGLFNND